MSANVENQYVTLERTSNQAYGIGQYAIDFLQDPEPVDPVVARRLEWFHADSIGCAIGALVRRMNAPVVLRREALDYRSAPYHAHLLGRSDAVAAEKAVVANCAAVRELDANGTNFGYNPARGDTAGEFGHNDFYPVVVAGAGIAGADGRTTLRAMLCLDEIRGRLAEVFSLKTHAIDHVVHGGIASAAVYGALLGASPKQIESAIGLLVAHAIPFRAIRAGQQLSDSKGASAAITAECAVTAVHRALRGFCGPRDIFRNPKAIFCLFKPPDRDGESPFDLHLARRGRDFAVMGMHFKLGLYEHQSAGAIEALIRLFANNPKLHADPNAVERLEIDIYEPAYSIIGDPAKRDPRNRQSADHSMVYIIATLWRKAIEHGIASWEDLMLLPEDYDDAALFDPLTRQLMQRIEFRHGGPEFDQKYPEGIPTCVQVTTAEGEHYDSGLVMFPMGHARGPQQPLESLLRLKFDRLVAPAQVDPDALWHRFLGTAERDVDSIRSWYAFPWGGPDATSHEAA